MELQQKASVLTECLNYNMKNSTFPNELKNAGVSLICKKKTVMISQIIDQLVFWHFYQNHLILIQKIVKWLCLNFAKHIIFKIY